MKKVLRLKQTGITLIALVVTVVVLLVLAGVTITMLTGNNGIILRAKEAKFKTELTGLNETKRLSEIGIEANPYSVTQIGSTAFGECISLKKIIILYMKME
ncbi:MAG: hypothetical protein V8R81_01920 [Clostridia bacterium]